MRTIGWDDERESVVMVDQTRLPAEYTDYHAETVDDLVESIEVLRVRGAPALGAAGAFGVALAAVTHEADDDVDAPEVDDTTAHEADEATAHGATDVDALRAAVRADAERVAEARPTAVNLARGVEAGLDAIADAASVRELRDAARETATDLADRDVERNRRIGEHGAALLSDGDAVMTHCNAGALATVDWGTALGVVYSAREAGKDVSVVANETRPLNQGSRITTVELRRRDVPVTLIPDNASGLAMQQGRVDAVVVGADRVVLDGGSLSDEGVVFNKVGTYKHAVLADRHDLPFVVAAPRSTIDEDTRADDVEIEQRDPAELREIYGTRNAPEDVPVYNPAFDATPMELVDHVVTEAGAAEPPLSLADLDGLARA